MAKSITVRTIRSLLTLALLAATWTVPTASAVEIEVRPKGRCTFTETDMTFTSFDGVEIDTTYYVPNTATPAHPQPAIMISHGFPGWHRGGGDMADQRMLASHCYVVLGFTERGLGNSGGEIELLSPDYEVRDARGLISWLARRPEVLKDRPGDPRVGMFGGSYAGGIQTLLATHDRRLDVITPQVTWNDLRYSLFPNGAIKQMWIHLLFAAGTVSGFCGPNYTAPECNARPPGWTPEAPRHVVVAGATNGDPTGEIQEWLAYRSPASYARRLRIPTLLVQGIGDTLFTINEAVRNYQAVRANGAPAKLMLFSGGHGQIDDPSERRYINQRVLQWLQRYLRRDRTVATGPEVEVFQEWARGRTPPDRFVPFRRWPVGKPMRLNLSSTGELVRNAPSAEAGAVTLANAIAPTSYSEMSNFQSGGGPNSPMDAGDHAEPLTAAAFRTEPLRRAATVIGQPTLRFTLTSTAGEAIVFWKVYDEAPDGSRVLVHHLVTPIRVTGAGTWPATAPITRPREITLALQSLVHRFDAGHRIVLTAATSDTAHYGSRIPGVHRIGVGPDSVLTLPVVP